MDNIKDLLDRANKMLESLDQRIQYAAEVQSEILKTYRECEEILMKCECGRGKKNPMYGLVCNECHQEGVDAHLRKLGGEK